MPRRWEKQTIFPVQKGEKTVLFTGTLKAYQWKRSNNREWRNQIQLMWLEFHIDFRSPHFNCTVGLVSSLSLMLSIFPNGTNFIGLFFAEDFWAARQNCNSVCLCPSVSFWTVDITGQYIAWLGGNEIHRNFPSDISPTLKQEVSIYNESISCFSHHLAKYELTISKYIFQMKNKTNKKCVRWFLYNSASASRKLRVTKTSWRK